MNVYWRPVEEYDALENKPAPCLFRFKADKMTGEAYCTTRKKGSRICTGYIRLADIGEKDN